MRRSLFCVLMLFAGLLILTNCREPLVRPEPPPLTHDPIPTRYPAADRIVAIGDLHGDLSATKAALVLAGLIDAEDRWTGGQTVLVQTGDQLDRGDNEVAILALLERLEEEAASAGGAVHILNGNHELMNAAGDLRYVTPKGFADFEPLVEVTEVGGPLTVEPESKRARLKAFLPGGPYALKLAKRNTVVIVGGNVFVHGGVTMAHIELGLERMNAEVRSWLSDQRPVPDYLHKPESLIWTRRYSDDTGAEECAELTRVLAALGAQRLIVGHTVQKDGITSACEDRVWRIDTGMSAHYGGPVQALEILGDQVRVLK